MAGPRSVQLDVILCVFFFTQGQKYCVLHTRLRDGCSSFRVKKIFLSGVGLCSKWVAKKSAPLNPFTPKSDQRGISPRYCF